MSAEVRDDAPCPVLFVDDEPENCTVFRYAFDGFEIETETNPHAALERITTDLHPVLVTDQRMPGLDGLSLAERGLAAHPDLVVVMVTAYADRDLLLRALNSGLLFRFVPKPWDPDEMTRILTEACEQAAARAALAVERRLTERRLGNRLEASARAAESGEFWSFADPDMQRLVSDVDRVAPTDTPVLLLGETGTGKEVFARRLHRMSRRSQGAFVAVNCGALPEGLIESELFGHRKGAFTGATADRRGRFALADGGTLFLDEVGELPLPAQAALLRVLQSGRFHPVGAEAEERSDARVVAATHRDLAAEVSAGRFREDLYWRLNQLQLTIPPLRERRADLDRLIAFFSEQIAAKLGRAPIPIDGTLRDRFHAHPWPGNLRELYVELQRIYLVGSPTLATAPADDEPPSPPSSATTPLKATMAEDYPGLDSELAAIEADRIREALHRTGGHPADAARLLGLKRPTLYYRMRRYGIGRDEELSDR